MNTDPWSRWKTARSVSKSIVIIALLSSFLSLGIENAATAASVPAVSEAVGFPVNAATLGGTTLTVNPQKVGDLIVFQSQISSHSITVTGVSCPETGAWHLAERYVDTVNGVVTEEIWWAVASSTGSTKITATYSSSIAALSPELVSDSFTTASASIWSAVSGNGAAAASTTAIVFPSVTSGSNTNQLYWGYVQSTQTALAGRTAGFTYSPTAEGNLITSSVALSPNTKYAPTARETPVSNNTSVGAIFAAGPAAGAYTVTFNGNGSTGGSMSPETASAPTALSANAFVNSGYNFAGWNTSANGTGTNYAAGASYPFVASTTLYAQWTAVKVNITKAAGFPVNSESLGGATLTVNPQKAGDIVIFQSQVHSTSITVTGVSCPETGAWHLAERYVDTVNGVIAEEIWWAVATSTGSTKITATYSGSIAAFSPELIGDSFTTSSSSVWSFVSGNGAAAASTTAIVFPSVTSGSNTNQLYWGYVESTQTALAGSTPGFTYSPTAEGNLITSSVALSPKTKYAPTAKETPVSNYTAIGSIFTAVAS